MNNKIRIAEIYGNNDYEIGYEIGKIFKDYLQKNIIEYEKKLNNKEILLKVEKAQKITYETYPNYVEEIYGRADGAEVDRKALFFMMSPELYEGTDGCTTVIAKLSSNRVLFAHNEDYITDMDKIALIKINIRNKWIVGYAVATRLLGHAFAYNSDGLVVSNNYIYGASINLNNPSRYFVIRDIIASKNIHEAIKKSQNADIASAISLNILDIKTNETLNIEKDNCDTNITQIYTRYARANHLLTKEINEKNIPKSSIFRCYKSKELLDKLEIKNTCMDDLVKILQYHTNEFDKCIYKDRSFFSDVKDRSKTCATFTFDSLDNKIQIYEYIGNELIDIEFDSFKIKRYKLDKIINNDQY